MKHLCVLLGLLTSLLTQATAQVYTVPFGSSGNNIELDLVNAGEQVSSHIEVRVVSQPDWVTFHSLQEQLHPLDTQESQVARFQFSVSKEAPIGLPGTIEFQVREHGQLLSTKEIRIQSEAPDHFELFQNYPNPFNPATTLSWQLPEAMNVELIIFNTLGQRVHTQQFRDQSAGKHNVRWEATRLASGV